MDNYTELAGFGLEVVPEQVYNFRHKNRIKSQSRATNPTGSTNTEKECVAP